MKTLFALAIAVFLLTQPALIRAGAVDPQPEEGGRVSLGVAMIVMPEYEGSKKHKFTAAPVIEYDQGRFFLSAFNGAGLRVINGPALQMGPLVKYRPGRDQDDSDDLKGMGDVSGGAEAGLFASWRIFEQVGLKAEIMHGLGAAKGFTADLSLNYSNQLTEDLNLSLGLGGRYADSKYNEEYFGVDARQSLNSGYKAYNPGGGLKHVATQAMLSYGLNDSLKLGVFGEFKRLTGPAADSPLVRRGSANQLSSGLALTWNN